MTKPRTIIEVAELIGAKIENPRNAMTTMSDYRTLSLGGRFVELRGSDHGNWPNPVKPEAVRSASVLRVTAPGFERALALWLGFSPNQIRGLKLGTQRDLAKLAAMTPAEA
jgi:hypothetical protein